MCNQVGANTELIFEGASMVIRTIMERYYDQLKSFDEDFATYELQDIIKGNNSPVQEKENRIASIYKALVLGSRDYFRKMNFRSAVLGLSGGIDSAVCLCIAAEALGPEKLRVLLLPSMYSSQHSLMMHVAIAR